MVSTTEFVPAAQLQPYIRCYSLREFDTGGEELIKPLPANHDLMMSFMLSGNLTARLYRSENCINSTKHLVGLQTSLIGFALFKGNVRLLNISFTANGYYQLFGVPAKVFRDIIVNLDEISLPGLDELEEKLNECEGITQLKTVLDTYFISCHSRQTNDRIIQSISATSHSIYVNKGNVNIGDLARLANMSMRSFETKFSDQVGLSPKLFSRIIRFNHAILVKMMNMDKSWTDICHDCGYYDQMHFIKEFKEFTGVSPLSFYKTTPPPIEEFKYEN